ncbi:ubiquitin-specific protease, putative [Phytophthora infestans T30-4]|uniref:ubiquitinyl hydrolase 1 n=1 Tax=Phytophthora infestans (strain T30-4) TaxID=403677 RepID=D0NGM2_PHYIT|nr:ubiquitin-specific protease, putative [Phytophthora infestans T30-4]EEY57423.1 ubiquitin-specific protease, putative [Phytophthora infestans T30-4]|eukprot:XP_002902033.1 ubiquitin-specific protease, putative [Phytophthora infestans T30-4]
MVEKRRSPVGDSPPEAQRRKKLNTRTDADVEPMDVDTPDAALPTLVFRETFPVLGLGNERVVTPSQKDAQGASWRVIWQPRSLTDDSFVGVFVELVEQDSGAVRVAELSITLLNQGAQPALVKHTSVHEFTAENADFGMSQFVQRSELMNPSNQFLDKQGRVELELRLSFVGDSTQQLISYDSKEETGMVGLKNQGATCYLNSLLQTLFHLRAFRQVVYATPTAQEDTNDSVSLALQRVFYRLQRQQKAVSTKELTRSFGWSAIDSFMQHDVQELYRILCDRLEEKMKNTPVDSAIQKLFEGKVRSFVECVNVQFQSSREERFYDLQLDVKGCKNLMQSFRRYVEVEMLDGDNQYEAEGHGKQDAKKGIEFLTFPPVLNIQLKRFEYDAMRDGMVKVHDRFEFPKTLVLDEFISKDKTKTDAQSPSFIYHLHSVLVHSGDVHGGHYYVFIRPGKHIAASTDWFRFDDDQITRVDEQVAVEGNFGSGGAVVTPPHGSTEPPSPLYSSSLFCSPERSNGANTEANGVDGLEFRSVDTGENTVEETYDYSQNNGSGSLILNASSNSLMLPLGRSFSSAYMLVYVRDGENDVSAIQDATSDEEQYELPSWQSDPLPIPQELVTRFHEEEQAVARRKKAQQTEHLYMNLRIASDSSIAKLKRVTKTLDFSGFNNSTTVRVRIKRAASIRQLYRRVYKETGVPMSRQRLWKVITRENRTTRPDLPLGPDVYESCVDSLIEDDASPKTPVKMYLQILDATSEAALSPASPSSPSIHDVRDKKTRTAAIHRHFLDEFSPPETKDEAKPSQELDEDDAVLHESTDSVVEHAPPLQSHDILLIIKFYDLKKKLGERLEYVGNVVVDSRLTGAQLADYLHEALAIPSSRRILLFEEVQPVTVSTICLETPLATAEIQNGDIICFQYAEDEEPVDDIVLKPDPEDNPDAVETYIGPDGQERRSYPDVRSYFRYLLDRVEVTFYRYGHSDEFFTLQLLLSNLYIEVIDAVAAHLDLIGPKRLFVRLYQHSPLNNLPMKAPLRHSRYAADDQTTLDDLLTEYMERTNILHYELLEHPITEIEAKKELLVHLSIYDACFATEQAASPSPVAPHRSVEVLVLPTHKVCDLLKLIRGGFGLPKDTPLRACEVVQHGTMIRRVIKEDAELKRYWGTGHGADANTPEILVEQIPIDELSDEISETLSKDNMSDDERPLWFYRGVVHFNFQNNANKWIHPHGVPCIVRFSEQETVGEVKERIRQRMGIASDVFAQWKFALVKDLKASTLQAVYDDMEAEALDAFPMSRLTELCGADFENLGNLGLEHADPTPPPRHHSNRRQETGIHIRQS